MIPRLQIAHYLGILDAPINKVMIRSRRRRGIVKGSEI